MSELHTLQFGRFEVRPLERQLLVEGQTAAIGSRAFDLLLALVTHPGRLLTKNELLDIVWPDTVVEENNLQGQISTLRRVLGPDAIVTIPGRGYRFCLELQSEPPSAALAHPQAVSRQAVHPVAQGQAQSPGSAGPPLRASSPAVPAPPGAGEGAAPLGNLPVQHQRPIGRDAELQVLQSLVTERPLVTVVGAGGMGKTTLALAAAAQLGRRFAEGACLVELASVTDPVGLVPAIAQAQRVTLRESGAPRQQLAAALRTQELLLVLDNCEQVVVAVGALVAELLANAPRLRVLVTSQEPLHVAGEHLLRLESLGLPREGEVPRAEAHGAVALFVERARAADPQFKLGESNAAAVAELCRRLDGMPLAIELAAARVRLLGVQGLRERIGERFRVLTGGARTALPRHQTLVAMLEWSHSLLGPAEQVLLRRLAVFVGGFSLELAQRVAADEQHDEWVVLDALGVLVDRSLVAADSADPPRYRLLESTRAFALERLALAGETEALRQRHALALRDFFERTDEERFGETGRLVIRAFMGRLAPELDNWRAALEWAGARADIATAIALAGAGAMPLRFLGHGQEALARLRSLAPHVQEGAAPSRAALLLARLAVQGRNGRMPGDELLEAAERAVRICRASPGARRVLHYALCSLAWARNNLGESEAAAASLSEAASLEHEADPFWVRAWRLDTQSAIEGYQGRFDAAVKTLGEVLALLQQRPGEDISLLMCRTSLVTALNGAGRHDDALVVARVALRSTEAHANRGLLLLQLLHAQTALGRLDEARVTMTESMPIWRRDAVLLSGAAELAELLAREGRWADAARLDGASERYVRESGVLHHPLLRAARRRMLEAFTGAGLDPNALERWRREGAAWDEEQLAARCLAPLGEDTSDGDGPPP